MERILIGTMIFYYFYIIAIMFYMFKKRKAAIIKKEIHIQHFKGYLGETTEELAVIGNHLTNQFQIPMFFFMACILTMQQQNVTKLSVGLAIAFVISRMIHSFIHLGSNHLLNRAKFYFIGVLIVGVMFTLNI